MGLNVQCSGALSHLLNQISNINVQLNKLQIFSCECECISSSMNSLLMKPTLIHLHNNSRDQLLVVFWLREHSSKKQISRGGIQVQFSPFIPLANTITGSTKYQLVLLAAAVGFKCGNCRCFQKNGQSPTTWNCQQTVQTGLIFFSSS